MSPYNYAMNKDTRKAYQSLNLSSDQTEGIQFYKDTIRELSVRPETGKIKREKLHVCLSLLSPMHILGYPDGALEILLDAERLAHELDDEKIIATISSRLGYYYTVKGNPLLGLWYSEKCLNERGKISTAIDSIVEIARNLCAAFWFAGNYAKVVDIAQRTLSIIEKHHKKKDLFADGVNAYSSLISWSGSALGWLGEFEEGKALLDKGLQNAIEVNDRFETGFIELMYSTLLFWEGDGIKTVDYARKAINYFEEVGADILLGTARMMLGSGYYLLRDYETARKHADKGLKTQTLPINLPWNYWHMGMIQSAAGDQEQAKKNFQEALKLSQELNTKACEGVAWISLGSVSRKASTADADEARQNIQQGITILWEQKLKALSSFGHLLLGELLGDTGQRKDALKNLSKAAAMYQEMGLMPGHYWPDRAQTALEELGTSLSF
jgi:tetratricopeptide (TPR) repeat protein